MSNGDSSWATCGKIAAVIDLILTPFIVVVPDIAKPYVIAACSGLNALNIFLAHSNGASNNGTTPTQKPAQ